MILESVKIEKKRWGADEGKYTGEASFSGNHGSVKVELPETAARQILELCAQNVITAANEVARAMVAPVIELKATKAIQAPKKKGLFS